MGFFPGGSVGPLLLNIGFKFGSPLSCVFRCRCCVLFIIFVHSKKCHWCMVYCCVVLYWCCLCDTGCMHSRRCTKYMLSSAWYRGVGGRYSVPAVHLDSSIYLHVGSIDAP